MDSSLSSKDEIWLLWVCHHISNAVYVLTTGLGGPHSWSGRFGERKNILSLSGSRIPDRPARSLVAIFSGCDPGSVRHREVTCHRARPHWSCSEAARTGGHSVTPTMKWPPWERQTARNQNSLTIILHSQESGVQFSPAARYFFSPKRPVRLCDPPSLLSDEFRRSFTCG